MLCGKAPERDWEPNVWFSIARDRGFRIFPYPTSVTKWILDGRAQRLRQSLTNKSRWSLPLNSKMKWFLNPVVCFSFPSLSIASEVYKHVLFCFSICCSLHRSVAITAGFVDILETDHATDHVQFAKDPIWVPGVTNKYTPPYASDIRVNTATYQWYSDTYEYIGL